MTLSTTTSLARQTRPLRDRLLCDEPLTGTERIALEELILAAACAVDNADKHGGLMISRSLVADHLTAVVRAADRAPAAAVCMLGVDECTCRISDPGGTREVRHRHEQCPVHARVPQ